MTRFEFVARGCRKIASSRIFETLIMTLIVANAVLLGMETSPQIMARCGSGLFLLNTLFQGVFVVEIAIRLAACWPRPLAFFRNGWNVFDFIVVAGSLMPGSGASTTIGRLLRLLRVTRLVSLSPGLRLIVTTMLTSIPSMGHVVALLSLLVYIYAILGYQFFHALDPVHWGNLPSAALALFQVITLEGWTELQNAVMHERPLAWLYFASFIVVAVFVVINLFIAVVINNLESAKEEQRHREDENNPDRILLESMTQIRAQCTCSKANSADGRPSPVHNSGENNRAEDSTSCCQKGVRRASRKQYNAARDKSA
jgi:voltage-gated sodium channel